MLLERAEISIKEGLEAGFATAMRDKGVGILRAFPGVESVSFGRGVENPGKFLLLVHWSDMAAHAAYNQAPQCQDLRNLIGTFSKGGAMEHFEMA